MCVVSAIQDHYTKRWPDPALDWRDIKVGPYVQTVTGPTRAEFEELKRLVEAAQKIDQVTGQPDCEKQDTTEWLQRLEARMTAIEDMNKEDSSFERPGGIMLVESNTIPEEAYKSLVEIGCDLSSLSLILDVYGGANVVYDAINTRIMKALRSLAKTLLDYVPEKHKETAQQLYDTHTRLLNEDGSSKARDNG